MSAVLFASSPKGLLFFCLFRATLPHVRPSPRRWDCSPKGNESPKQGQTWGDSKTAHNEKSRLHSGSGGWVPGDAYQRRPRAKALSMAGSSTVRIFELRPSFRYALQMPW